MPPAPPGWKGNLPSDWHALGGRPQVGCPLTVRHLDWERLMKINAAIARLITSILFQPAGHNMALCARAVRHFENFANCSGGHRPSYPEPVILMSDQGEEM